MFESLQEGITSAIRSLRGRGKLTEANMREGLELVQRALLDADVNIAVVKQFINDISREALGEKVLKSLDPTKHLIGIVYDELVKLMGPVDHSLHLKSGDVSILMLCGLQGSGKTTTCGKLGRLIQQRGRQVMLVAADLQRPAAIDQLAILGGQLGLKVYADRSAKDPVALCQAAAREAKQGGVSVLILDTAGRLHVDAELMEQLRQIDRRVAPDQVYLVVDAMTGQDAVNSAKAFNDALELDGVIMTKLDGDARGGAALSVKAVTGVPIKFIGTGEHLDALEEFHPDRMASRILGMGDIITLVEKAREKFDAEEIRKQEEKLREGEFTLDDFKKLLLQTKRLGPLNKILSFLPGMGSLLDMFGDKDMDADMKRLVGIIDSMTPEERRRPGELIDHSRRRRIANGAGVAPHDVSELVKQFEPMAEMMRQIAHLGPIQRMRAIQQLTESGALNPGARLGKTKIGTGKRLTSEEKAKLRKQREKEERRRRREQREKRK